MTTIAIISKPGETSAKLGQQIIRHLLGKNCRVRVPDNLPEGWDGVEVVPEAEVVDEADLIVVLGGDGTMLHVAHLVNGRNSPVLGINLGRLGFLAEIAPDDALKMLDRVLEGDYIVSERRMLRATLMRDGNEIISRVVLNDAVINKGALARIMRLEAFTEDGIMTTYRGDGLIVSTPTGSTAYNMAAGGPVIYPTLDAYVMTPICPHTFANRAVVLPDDRLLTVELVEANGEVYLSLDGQEGAPMEEGDRLLIQRARLSVKLIRSPEFDFFHILRHKLSWGQV